MPMETAVPDRPIRSYMICTAPRSGSTMLCKLLAATGVAGKPGSLLHTPSFEGWLSDYELNEASFPTKREALHAIFVAALSEGRGGTDVFGLRMQRGSFDHFVSELAFLYPETSNDLERIEAAFGPTLFIHLSRPDRLGQAISRLRAEQSGLWHLNADGTDLERLPPRRTDDGYDRAAIAAFIKEATEFDHAWEDWFQAQGMDPLRITYDQLSETPHAVIAYVLSALGLDPKVADTLGPQTKKLADATSETWRARFEAKPDLF